MSAGLMSCVRENSPPLEMGDPVATPPPDTPGKSLYVIFYRKEKQFYAGR